MIGIEYKYGSLSPVYLSHANFPTRNPMNILWSREACHCSAHFINSRIRSALPYIYTVGIVIITLQHYRQPFNI